MSGTLFGPPATWTPGQGAPPPPPPPLGPATAPPPPPLPPASNALPPLPPPPNAGAPSSTAPFGYAQQGALSGAPPYAAGQGTMGMAPPLTPASSPMLPVAQRPFAPTMMQTPPPTFPPTQTLTPMQTLPATQPPMYTLPAGQFGANTLQSQPTLTATGMQSFQPSTLSPEAMQQQTLAGGMMAPGQSGPMGEQMAAPQGPPVVQIKVFVWKANGLRKGDPYCICDVGAPAVGTAAAPKPHSEWKTVVKKKTLDPEWNEEHLFITCNMGDAVHFRLYAKEEGMFSMMKKDELLGKFSLSYDQFYPNGFQGALQLTESGKEGATLTAKISINQPGTEYWHAPEVMQPLPLLMPGELRAMAPAPPPAAAGAAAAGPGLPPLGSTAPGTLPSTAPSLGGMFGSTAPGSTAPGALTLPAPVLGQAPGALTLPGPLGARGQDSMTTGLLSSPGYGGSTLASLPAAAPGTMAGDTATAAALLGLPSPPMRNVAPAKQDAQATRRWIQQFTLNHEVQPAFSSDKDQALKLASEAADRNVAIREGMFVIRLRTAFDLMIPLAAGNGVLRSKWPEALKMAEQEVLTGLSLRLRLSFIDSFGDRVPALYGHTRVTPKLSMLTPKMTVQSAVALGSNVKGQLGHLKVSVVSERPLDGSDKQALIFFRAGADTPDKQLLIELLAEVEPQLVAFPQAGHVMAPGEGIRIRADGWQGNLPLGGGVAFTVDLRSANTTDIAGATGMSSGGVAVGMSAANIALRWAPSMDGESVIRNAMVAGTWGPPEIAGGWPHQSAAPSPGLSGGPFTLDFRYGATQWEVWVDGIRLPEFDFAHRGVHDVGGVDWSLNLINPQAFIIPKDPFHIVKDFGTYRKDVALNGSSAQRGTAGSVRTKPIDCPPRLWRVDDGAIATLRPPKAVAKAGCCASELSKHDLRELYGAAEPVAFGWTCVRLDGAAESRRTNSGTFRLGSLHDWLEPPPPNPKTGLPQPVTKDVRGFLVKVEGQPRVGNFEYEIERVQMERAARRLLPPDFPAVPGQARLGGISSSISAKGPVCLRAADACDCFLRDISVSFPDDRWLTDVQQNLVIEDPAARRESVKTVHSVYLRVGSHNCLKWLDESVKSCVEGRISAQPGTAPDDSGQSWKLGLEQQGQGRWIFRGGDVPIEFICDVDCGLVLELVVVFMSSKRGTGQTSAAAAIAAGAAHLQHQTVSWTLLLPLKHTSDDALRQATDSQQQQGELRTAPVVYYSMELLTQEALEGRAISGNKVFKWAPKHKRATTSAPFVQFGVAGDAFLRWLKRRRTPLEIPRELKGRMQPVSYPGYTPQAPDLLPQRSQDATTQALLQQPTTQLQVDTAVAQGLLAPGTQLGAVPAMYPQLQPAPPPFPGVQAPPWVQPPPPPSADLQTVVERIYLRDQGTQSDPPPLPGLEDHIIGDGRPVVSQDAATAALLGGPGSPQRPGQPGGRGTDAVTAALLGGPGSPSRVGQPYTGPSMRPLPGGSATRLALDVGEAGAQRIMQGLPYTKTAAPRREMRWRLEDDDPLQADEVTIEFLAYRSFAGASSERVHFQLRFFMFPPLKTSSSVLAGGPGEACMLRSAVTNDRLALLYHVDGANRGASSEVHRQLAEFFSARNAEVEVWNSDSVMQIGSVTVPLEALVRQGHQVTKLEGEFPVLDPMTGQTRGSIQLLVSCRGRTPVRPAIQGAQQMAVPALPGAVNFTPGAVNFNTSVLSEAPSVLNQSAVGNASLAGGATTMPVVADVTGVKGAERERGRVRHKAQALLAGANGPSTMVSMVQLPDDAAMKRQRLKQLRMLRGTDVAERFSDHSALLSAAEEVRVDRKRAEVARRMDRFNTSQLTVLAPFANSSFFGVEFTNPYNQQAAFIVTISEPQRPAGPGVVPAGGAVGVQGGPPRATAPNFQGILEAPPDESLALVKDPAEWRRLVTDRKVPPPPTGEFTQFNSLGQFALRPGETIFLPFRYLAFSHPSLASVAQTVPVGGVSLEQAEQQTLEVPDRIFVIEVLVHQGPPLKRVEVTARAQPCVVDRTVRFFEVEGTPIEKTLALPARPAFSGHLHGAGQRTVDMGRGIDVGQHSMAGYLSATMDGRADRYVYCTDNEVHLQWKDDDSLQLRLLAPMSPMVRRFFVLCYADAHFMKVIAAQLVEVHSMKSEHIRVSVGHSVDRTISLPPVELLETSIVQAYSSDPELLSVKQAATVDPRYGAKLELTICATRAGTRTCRLHATDPTTRRRVAAFLVVIAADMPEVKMAHDITLQLNMSVRKHLRYKNETMRPLRYSVKSSDPSIATVQTPELMLPPGDTRVIELFFHAQPATMSYTAEIYLFVTSEDRAIQETRLLQLTYT